ncbi:MAG: M48 family metalloprotease [Vampirovibrionales bacterium]|nr:M48 family metalloprotease [Vampirovibrionales bacterium]
MATVVTVMIKRQGIALFLTFLMLVLSTGSIWAEGENDPMWRRRTDEKKVVAVGQRLLKENNIRQSIGFGIRRLDSPNAFASSYVGQVVISNTMLRYIDSDDELAGVLAHEIAHVLKHHSPKGLVRRTAGTVLVTGLLYGVDLVLFLGIPVVSAMYLGHVARGGSGMADVMSRSQEYEADKMGVDLMTKARYNPYAFVSLMRKIGGDGDNIWLSHPMTSNRLARVEAQILKQYPDIDPPASLQNDVAETTPHSVQTMSEISAAEKSEATATRDTTSPQEPPAKGSVSEVLDTINPSEDPELAIRQLSEVIARQQKELDALKQSTAKNPPAMTVPANAKKP